MGAIFKGLVLFIEAIGTAIVGIFSLVGLAISGIGIIISLVLMVGVTLLLLAPVIFLFLLIA